MNFIRAKNILLVSLIFLNIILLSLNLNTKRSYALSNYDENAIISVLNEYNIKLTAYIPEKYEPMKDMNIYNIGNSISEPLIELLFKNELIRTEEGDRIVYSNEEGTLILQNGFYNFTPTNGINKTQEEIVKEFNGLYLNLYFDKSFTVDNSTVYDYREEYENYIFYSDYLEIVERDNLITRISGYISSFDSFTGDKKEIVSPDMVLFNFAKEARKIYGDEELEIDKMDIVYYLYDEEVFEEGVTLKAIPCYRVSVVGNERYFLINAYDNSFLNL